jgi:hypothetical protein
MALLGAGAYIYIRHKHAQEALAAMAPGSTAALPATTTAEGANNPGQTLPVPTVVPTLPPGIDPTTYAAVQKWAQADNRAPVLTMAAAAVPSEYNGMADIILNYWDAGRPIGQTQTDFWNALRAKYDPTHQIW